MSCLLQYPGVLISYTDACVERSEEAEGCLSSMNRSVLTGLCLCGFRVPPPSCLESLSVEVASAAQGYHVSRAWWMQHCGTWFRLRFRGFGSSCRASECSRQGKGQYHFSMQGSKTALALCNYISLWIGLGGTRVCVKLRDKSLCFMDFLQNMQRECMLFTLSLILVLDFFYFYFRHLSFWGSTVVLSVLCTCFCSLLFFWKKNNYL